MSDVNSSLPIRTVSNGDVVAKLSDGTLPSQLLAIDASGKITSKLNDSAGNSLTSQTSGSQQALDVGVNVAGVQVDPRAIRALTSADAVTATLKDSSGASITAANALNTQLSIGGSVVSGSNPLSVAISPIPVGTLVNKYNTTAAVAVGATTNHDYTVTTSKTFTGKKFWASASGRIRADVQVSIDGTTFTTTWTAFNSTANPNIAIDLGSVAIQDAGTGAKVRVAITNDDLLAQDVYSTISGTEQ